MCFQKVTVEYKSVSQVEVETRAKQKKIDEQVATAEKVAYSLHTHTSREKTNVIKKSTKYHN